MKSTCLRVYAGPVHSAAHGWRIHWFSCMRPTAAWSLEKPRARGGLARARRHKERCRGHAPGVGNIESFRAF